MDAWLLSVIVQISYKRAKIVSVFFFFCIRHNFKVAIIGKGPVHRCYLGKFLSDFLTTSDGLRFKWQIKLLQLAAGFKLFFLFCIALSQLCLPHQVKKAIASLRLVKSSRE